MRAPSRRPAAPWWIVPAILAGLGAAPPEVVRVRVPSSKVANWFPPGSDLQVLPFDRFEALMKAARDRPAPPQVPRLLKARHSARWEAGRLLGRTELTFEGGPGLLILEPWSPAAVDSGAGSKLLRATADGRLGLKVTPAGPSKVEFEWTLRARPGSEGLAFTLDLPALDVATLALDLPARIEPEASAGPRVGPESGMAPGHSAWRFEAARGRVDLRLRDRSAAANAPGAPGLWLEGTTRVDLGAGPVNWRADWTLDESPGAPRSLTIGLDPGLEVVDVAGPRVASFRLEADGPGSRVAIQLGGEGEGPSPVTIRATCPVPSEGTWTVPSARPLDASWTGGRTLVRLDAARVLQSCLERSGRRVPPRSGEPAEAADLVFEPRGGPGPVADLTFRRPTADATVEVRGHLRLGDEAPRIKVALTWSVEKARVLPFAADLPAGWTPDAVVSASGQPVAWHGDPLTSGGTRVHLAPTVADEASRSITVTLSASARGAGVTGPLELPRVRPAPGVRVVDEVWVATPDAGLAVKPTLASGLAWLDPPDPSLDDVPTPWSAADLEGTLAWRWLVEGAEARVDRTPPAADPRGEVRLDATIRPGRLALDWTIDVEPPRGALDLIPIHLDEPASGPVVWRAREAGGPILEARAIDEARRTTLGFPATGQAWDLVLSGPPRKKVQILGRLEGTWAGRGRIPILTLPDRYEARGVVGVVVGTSTRAKFEATGLTPIEPSASAEGPSGEPDDAASASASEARTRKAAVYGYRSGGGRLMVETTDPPAGPRGGFIREAFLVSHASPGAGMRHRLSLGIAADSARSLKLRMPQGVGIDRLRRDGQPVAPTPAGDALIVEIPAPAPGRPLCSVTIEYRTEDDFRAGPVAPASLLPGCSLPCLGFAWEVVAPETWRLDRAGSGLHPTDPRPAEPLASRLLGFHWSPWGDGDRARPGGDETMLLDLEKAAAEIADGESNLGDWILKLDAGRWPLVLDRLAIRSSGWGPGSRINSNPAEAKWFGPVRSVLEPMGLVAVPLAGMILITARDEVSGRPEDLDAWSAAIRPVPSRDRDEADRFQSAARWRGESTPRALASGESPAFASGRSGWRAWRVVADAWPSPGASVSLVDSRADRAGAGSSPPSSWWPGCSGGGGLRRPRRSGWLRSGRSPRSGSPGTGRSPAPRSPGCSGAALASWRSGSAGRSGRGPSRRRRARPRPRRRAGGAGSWPGRRWRRC